MFRQKFGMKQRQRPDVSVCLRAFKPKKPAGLLVQRPGASSVARVCTLPFTLQTGELEALALALEMTDALLVVDDAQGRRAAQTLGLAYTGTLGILLRAKEENKLSSLRLVLELLQQRTFFRVSGAVYQAALKQAGEQS